MLVELSYSCPWNVDFFLRHFGIGGILTFTVTDYSADTDITKTSTPASSLTTTLPISWQWSAWSSWSPFRYFRLSLFTCINRHLLTSILIHRSKVIFGRTPCLFHMSVQLFWRTAFVSIFTANLYTDGYTAHNKTSVFLLNPNATRDELDGVTPELFETRHQPYHMVLHVDDRWSFHGTNDRNLAWDG